MRSYHATMTLEMSLEWISQPDAEERLYEELYARAGRPLPSLGDDENRPRTIGSVAARREGTLLGWAWLYEDPDGEHAARVQALYVPREAHRLETGRYSPLPPPAEEFEMVTGLYRRAAQEARAASYRTLRWSGPDTGPDGQAATALNAYGHGEYARTWSTNPATWQPPAGLPDAPARRLPEPDLTLATADAEISAAIEGHMAHLNAGEAIRYQRTEPRTLAPLIAQLVTHLRHDHPTVTELSIWEFDDTVRQALLLAGLSITGRHMAYELPLTPS